MMLIRLLCLVLVVLSSTVGMSQAVNSGKRNWKEGFKIQPENPYLKHHAYLQLGGNALLYSFNYERLVWHMGKFGCRGRIGIGGWGVGFSARDNIQRELNFIVPMGLNGFYGGKHQVEFGYNRNAFWFVEVDANETTFENFGFVMLGWRNTFQGDGFLRLSVLTYGSNLGNVGFWPGLSVGKSF